MSIVFKLLVLMVVFVQCKTKGELDSGTAEKNNNNRDFIFNIETDTIFCKLSDTIIVELPVDFSKGRIWQSNNSLEQVFFIKQDETQKYFDQTIKDIQRFHYMTRDTGLFKLVYELMSPFGKDTTVYESISKVIIIKH